MLFIFKELLQNAEDAGARNVKFLLDETHYGEVLGVDPDDPYYGLLVSIYDSTTCLILCPAMKSLFKDLVKMN